MHELFLKIEGCPDLFQFIDDIVFASFGKEKFEDLAKFRYSYYPLKGRIDFIIVIRADILKILFCIHESQILSAFNQVPFSMRSF